MTSLYNCRHDGDIFRITKFDTDWNVEASYLCDLVACECPAGHRPKCRHREMLPKFIQRGHVGDEWFFDHDRGGWVQGASIEIEQGFNQEMQSALEADGEKLRQLTGEDHGPVFLKTEPDPQDLVWLSPSLYDEAVKEGFDMRYHRKQELLPISEPSPIPTIRRRV